MKHQIPDSLFPDDYVTVDNEGPNRLVYVQTIINGKAQSIALQPDAWEKFLKACVAIAKEHV